MALLETEEKRRWVAERKIMDGGNLEVGRRSGETPIETLQKNGV